MEIQKVFTLTESVPMLVAPANPTRRGYRVENLDASHSVVIRAGRVPVLAGVAEVRTLSFDGAPDAGSFKIRFNGGTTAAIGHDANAAAVQTALRALPGLGAVTVAGSFGDDFAVTMTDAPVPAPKFEIVENSLTVLGEQAVQELSFSNVPDSGSYKLRMTRLEGKIARAVTTGPIPHDANAGAIQAVLRALLADYTLAVTGDAADGFEITFGPRSAQRKLEVVEDRLSVHPTQVVEFDAVPDGGAFELAYGETAMGPFAHDVADLAAAVQTDLRTIEGLEAVTVTGNFADGLEVKFVGVANPELLTEESNTLEAATEPVEIAFAEFTTTGAAVAHETIGAEDAPVEVSIEIDPVGDSPDLGELVRPGEVFETFDGAKVALYALAENSGVDLKVTTAF